MSSTIRTVKEFINANSKWRVTATVEAGSSLPEAIFLYMLSDEGLPVSYKGIVSKSELSSRPVSDGVTPQPTFGNRYVRMVKMQRDYESEEDADNVIAKIVKDATSLSFELDKISSKIETHHIP